MGEMVMGMEAEAGMVEMAVMEVQEVPVGERVTGPVQVQVQVQEGRVGEGRGITVPHLRAVRPGMAERVVTVQVEEQQMEPLQTPRTAWVQPRECTRTTHVPAPPTPRPTSPTSPPLPFPCHLMPRSR